MQCWAAASRHRDTKKRRKKKDEKDLGKGSFKMYVRHAGGGGLKSEVNWTGGGGGGVNPICTFAL